MIETPKLKKFDGALRVQYGNLILDKRPSIIQIGYDFHLIHLQAWNQQEIYHVCNLLQESDEEITKHSFEIITYGSYKESSYVFSEFISSGSKKPPSHIASRLKYINREFGCYCSWEEIHSEVCMRGNSRCVGSNANFDLNQYNKNYNSALKKFPRHTDEIKALYSLNMEVQEVIKFFKKYNS